MNQINKNQLEEIMKTAIIAFLSGLCVLFLLSLWAGQQVFPPLARALTSPTLNQPPTSAAYPAPAPLMTEAEYKKFRLAFNSFDLAAGLTRLELENLPHHSASIFYLLLACLWMLILLLGRPPEKFRK